MEGNAEGNLAKYINSYKGSESEEAIEPDASETEEENAEDSEDENSEEEADLDQEKEGELSVESLQAKIKKLEEDAKDKEDKRSSWQSRADASESALRQLREDFENYKQEVKGEADDPFADLDDEELVPAGRAKKAFAMAKQKPAQQKPDPNFNSWLASQPDAPDVNEFFEKNREYVVAKLNSTRTNEYGQFFMIRAMQRDDKLKHMEASHKDELDKLKKEISKLKGKKKIVKMGPGGTVGKERSVKSEAPLMRYFSGR